MALSALDTLSVDPTDVRSVGPPALLLSARAGERQLAISRRTAAHASWGFFTVAAFAKVSSELQEIIRRRPKLFADLIRQLKEAPDDAVLRIVREVRDGNW